MVSDLLLEFEPMNSISVTLKELVDELQSTPDNELRFLIEDRTDSTLEGRSPIRKKNYLIDFKEKLKEGSLNISEQIAKNLKLQIYELLKETKCVLKQEIQQILTTKSRDLLQQFSHFIKKINLCEQMVFYLQDFREEIRKILSDITKGIDPELYSEVERATRSNKVEEYIEYLFKIQQILLRVEKSSRFASDLRTQLEHQIKSGYFKAFRLDIKKFILLNKRDFNNLALHRGLEELLQSLQDDKSETVLKGAESLMYENKRKGNSDFWAQAQLLLLRCNMILFRLGLQNLLKRVPANEFNQLNFLINERLYEKSLEDSPEIYPEVSEILEKNPKMGTYKFKQALQELSNQFQINKVKKESNKPILKSKPTASSTFLPLSLVDNSTFLNESNLDISMSPSDLTDMMEYKEISPKILILESSKFKSISKEDYLNLWDNSAKNRQYHDEIFMNNFSSLCFSSSKPAFPEWKTMKWLRIKELYRVKKVTLLQNLNSSFIEKNSEIPLYLYNALLAINENEFIFKRNFEDQVINDKGIYFVKICQDGVWRYIILDDFMPCSVDVKGKGYRPSFLGVDEYEKNKIDIWPLLIIKALAKIYTTYQSIITNGCFYHTLRDLTGFDIFVIFLIYLILSFFLFFFNQLINIKGAPITLLPMKEKQNTSKLVKDFYERGMMLMVGGLDPINNTTKDPAKIPTKEASKETTKIAINGKTAINNNNKINTKIIINDKNNSSQNSEPISTEKQKDPPLLDTSLVYQIAGVFKIKSSLFFDITHPLMELESLPESLQKTSEKIQTKIKELNNDDYLLLNTDKSLFLEYDDLFSFFPEIITCHLYPEYFYVARTITHVKNTYCIRTFTLQSSSHCFLEVSQVDKRYFRGLDYDYSPVRILIGRVEGPIVPGNMKPTLKYMGGVYKHDRNTNIELNLDAGIYWVLVCFDWRKNTYDATLNYYGEEKILLDKVSYNMNRGLLEDFGGLIAKAFGQKIKLQADKVVLFFYASTFDCLIVEHLINNLPNKSLYIMRDYSFLDSTKIMLMGKYQKFQKVEVKVEPMKCETIMFKVSGVESLEKLHMMLENK